MTKEEAKEAFLAGVELIEFEQDEPPLPDAYVDKEFEAWWKRKHELILALRESFVKGAAMKHKMYLHSSKESNYGHGLELGLSGVALDNFKFALYEVELDVETDEKTGETTILAVNGRTLEPASE